MNGFNMDSNKSFQDFPSFETNDRKSMLIVILKNYFKERLVSVQSIVGVDVDGSSSIHYYDHKIPTVLQESNDDNGEWDISIRFVESSLCNPCIEVSYSKHYSNCSSNSWNEETNLVAEDHKFKRESTVFSYRADVYQHCNASLTPRLRSYLITMEIRERILLSQVLNSNDFDINEHCTIMWVNDEIIIKSKDFESFTENLSTKPLALGNTVILNWGRVVFENEHFHNKTQLYPIGFRCLRHEFDMYEKNIVNVLCEIDGVYTTINNNTQDDSGQILYSEVDEHARVSLDKRYLTPIFRITLDWTTVKGNSNIIVYEGSSPQQVWQAVLLETNDRHDSGKNYEVNNLLEDSDGKGMMKERQLSSKISIISMLYFFI